MSIISLVRMSVYDVIITPAIEILTKSAWIENVKSLCIND